MLALLNLNIDDVFVDVGCGKGRVLCCVARLPIKRAVGIELNPKLLADAICNANRLHGRKCPIETILLSADDYEFHDATVAYLYNPFNLRLTRCVLGRLRSSLRAAPRKLRIVYANPVHEEALLENHWLTKYHEWPASAFPGFGYRVSFYETSGPVIFLQ